MKNPIKSVADWWTAPAKKLYLIDDYRAALRVNTLVHGPGASELMGYRAMGGTGNSAVFACLNNICKAFVEAPLRVYRETEPGKREPIPNHPLQGLLDRPNDYLTAVSLWYWVQWAKHVDGNAYLRKIRSGNATSGNVVELWPISPVNIEPFTEKGSGDFITAYKYNYAPGKFELIPPENIVHFRLGIDDADMRLGLSPLKRLVRETCTDEEASKWTDTMLKNGAAAGLVIIPPVDNTTTGSNTMTEEQALELKRRARESFQGDGRGDVMILSNGADAKQFAFSPEQMDLRTLHRVPEERISAVLDVPAVIAGLGAGLDRSTYNNTQEAHQDFAENTILTLYRFDAATLNLQLLPDFNSDKNVRCDFDITDLRALQEDEDRKYLRLDAAVKTGWITPNEARTDVGLPPIDGGDVPVAPQQQPGGGANVPTGLSLPATEKPTAAGGRTYALKAGSLADYPELLRAIVDLAQPGFEAQLDEYFAAQRARVQRALVRTGPG